MAFWQRFLGLVSGSSYRQEGTQLGTPSYSNSAAVTVTIDSAFQLSTVWACTKLITETVSSLPLIIYKNNNGVKTPDNEHRLSILFRNKVNRWQTLQEFLETMMYQYVPQGNAFAYIQRNSRNEVVSLIPLMTQQMTVTLLKDGSVTYEYTDGANVHVYSQDSIMHWKMFGNGIVGLSPIAYARDSIGIGQAIETAVTKIYKNGGKPSGVLILDKILTPEQRAIIKANFAEMAEGNDDRLHVLEAGMKYQQLSLSPQDIELLKSRRFQIEDICRFFGVPSVLVNDTAAGTTWGSGIQQIVQGFYKLNLKPYLTRIQSSLKNNLMTIEERQNYDIEFDFNVLIQPDWSERVKTYKEAITGGFLSPNEARRYEGWTDKEGGDDLYMQQQMTPVSVLKDLDRSSNGTASQPSNDNTNAMINSIITSDLSAQIKTLSDKVENKSNVQPNFTINIPEIKVPDPVVNYNPDLHFNVPSPEITVRNEVAAPIVNVSAPEVKVEPNINFEATLPPPEVQVILPTRRSETKVEYDNMGNIVRTVQIEKDA